MNGSGANKVLARFGACAREGGGPHTNAMKRMVQSRPNAVAVGIVRFRMLPSIGIITSIPTPEHKYVAME